MPSEETLVHGLFGAPCYKSRVSNMINAVGDFEPSATTQNVAVEEVISCKVVLHGAFPSLAYLVTTILQVDIGYYLELKITTCSINQNQALMKIFLTDCEIWRSSVAMWFTFSLNAVSARIAAYRDLQLVFSL
ncbi:MAG: hypothetical protein EZS28_017992 [Streblomastix strix]|uniref:Uncharacterized protein n=1 Tax=Streblomastix strix TaxID=222440 RepID=A0A5J4VVD3_9EUKA|nr:MAG: hypothetical protein EZS28_017992 [Streblomastix strix]